MTCGRQYAMVSLLKKLLGSRNDRRIKQYRKLVAQINGHETAIAALSDDDRSLVISSR